MGPRVVHITHVKIKSTWSEDEDEDGVDKVKEEDDIVALGEGRT